jgi:hypothetical protein
MTMVVALNLTAPLKQDPASQEALKRLVDNFATTVQPRIDAVLVSSQLVHYARLLVIDNKYIQVLTEFDGDPLLYTEFFRQQLPDVFKAVFALIEGAPSWEEIDSPDAFFRYSTSLNLRSLGEAAPGTPDHGYLFSAFGQATVRDIQSALGQQPGGAAQPAPEEPTS